MEEQLKLPQTLAGRVELATYFIECSDSLPWYNRLIYRIKFGKNWKSKLYLHIIEKGLTT